MPKLKAPDPVDLVRRLDPAVILKAAALCDGHSILAPQAFTAVGMPPELVEQLSHDHQSDTRSPRSTIYRDGQAVTSVRGVYGLHVLEFLAGALDVPYRRRIGRGFQADAIREALHEHFRSRQAPAPAEKA